MKRIAQFYGLIVALAVTSPVIAELRNVPGQYATVAAAVEAAQPGDVVEIAAGDYDISNVRITQDRITIQGAGRSSTILWVPSDQTGFLVLASGIIVRDLRFESRNTTEAKYGLVTVYASGELELSRIETVGGRNGLHVSGGSLWVTSSRLSASQKSNIIVTDGGKAWVERSELAESTESAGIDIWMSGSSAQVTDSVIHNHNQSGVSLSEGGSARIFQTTIANNGYHGASVQEENSRLDIESSIVTGNRHVGIWTFTGAHATVTNTAITANGSWGISRTENSGDITGTMDVNHSLLWDNRRGDTEDFILSSSNVQADPKFLAPDNYIFALLPDSPAKGAGRDGKDIGLYPEGYATAFVLPQQVDQAKTPGVVRRQPAPSRPRGRKLALVIGIEQYSVANIPKLKYARDDADDVARFLTSKGYSVTKLVDATATLPRIRTELTKLANAPPQDQIVFFFSGHGSDESDPLGRGRGYLLPVGADADQLPATALPLAELQAVVDNTSVERMAVLLDACFSGGQKSVRTGRQGIKTPGEKDLTGGLVFGPGKVSLFSSRDNEPSYEAAEYENGYFTYHLIKAWEEGYQEADAVYQKIFEGVTQDTDNAQHPRRDYDRTEGVTAVY
ncbi:exported protein of unknown function [uncultured Woeseiaceae bacterium]|uniref:Caspase family p20 domain-containing protein n=1 Tax=uncultured Woeseiaceae bacterium TaxID=1983305 RepID=A0A7D9D166_9GAMM|nr:exported protein of unknown function [uncultured Woeseiaceae bacterium]